MVRLNLSLDDVRNCKKTARFFGINKDFCLKNIKSPTSSEKFIKKIKQVKLVKVLEKCPKLEW